MRTCAVFLLATLMAAAQFPAQNWDTVKALTTGTEVRIVTSSHAIHGEMIRATDDTLVVTSGKGQEMFTHQEVTRVSIRKKGHRLWNTLLGFGAGTGIGLGIGAASEAGCRGWFCGLNTAAGGVIGAVGGTVAGAVWPTGGWREVYKQQP